MKRSSAPRSSASVPDTAEDFQLYKSRARHSRDRSGLSWFKLGALFSKRARWNAEELVEFGRAPNYVAIRHVGIRENRLAGYVAKRLQREGDNVLSSESKKKVFFKATHPESTADSDESDDLECVEVVASPSDRRYSLFSPDSAQLRLKKATDPVTNLLPTYPAASHFHAGYFNSQPKNCGCSCGYTKAERAKRRLRKMGRNKGDGFLKKSSWYQYTGSCRSRRGSYGMGIRKRMQRNCDLRKRCHSDEWVGNRNEDDGEPECVGIAESDRRERFSL